MSVVKIVVWQEKDTWLGYLQDHPDYWTQGETEEDLRIHLKDLFQDLTSGALPGVRRVEDLLV
jgi:predicted RNase H-like HicB family nuclease